MKKIIYTVVGLLVLAGVVWLIVTPGKAGKYDQFAMCIKSSGAQFYGAFWCPHCQAQKARFGKSAQYLPYNECSTADGQGQLQYCTDKGVQSYPTWFFPQAGTTTLEKVAGEIELVDLAKKTGCSLP